jgi:signal transduction histidine kinase
VPGKGTSVRVGKIIAHAAMLDAAAVAAIGAALAREQANSPYEELQQQNQELLAALDELRASKANVDRLNQELEETNRGVVALYAELDDRANEMRRMSETKTRFLSDVSHELRTPLTSIINLSGLLISHADGELNAEQEKQVSLMKRSAESLAEMVNDLLDIAKIEAGKVDLRLEPVTVAEIFGTLRGMFRPLMTSDAVHLVFDENTSIAMFTDERRVSQVLRNFISNAVKFTLAGEIRVGAVLDGDNVQLFVSDTGTGIAPKDQERIFEEFSQVDGPIQRRVRGTGLGLPLTRKLAALLGGHVTLDSEPGRGSTFALVIPRELPAGDARA